MNKLPRDGSPQQWDKVLDREFKGESDRACVILAGALLDSALETAIKTYLVPCSTGRDPLFTGNGPLSSFNARIEIAYRIGVIDLIMARNLHLIRRIRNDFAHNISGCTFEDSSVLSRMTELRRSSRLPERAPDKRKLLAGGPRGDFQMIVSWIQWALRSMVEEMVPLQLALPACGEFPLDEPDDE